MNLEDDDDDAFINKCRQRFLSMPCIRPIFSAKTTTTTTTREVTTTTAETTTAVSALYVQLFLAFCLGCILWANQFSGSQQTKAVYVRVSTTVCVCQCVCVCDFKGISITASIPCVCVCL